ncbi:hypothetical protein [Telluribacter humicola]|uniref:hypothetical protein n=1 Tax=Telluribacter humicola TaxID=1720261 RepID=UPI001A964F7E|nr:hypothetical protein [Telluribacter humicola]
MKKIDTTNVISTETDGLVTKYVIRNGSYLGDVFDSLPPGIISKSETGMGATTLEFNTPRNSIIVEPIKITASSKAHKHGAMYVGSETQYHLNKVRKDTFLTYISNPSIQYKKIVVVADSLWKVIDWIGDTVYKDFHILIDEADSFQLDSLFRSSMESSFDYYKLFPQDQRSMVSATMLKFSDPDLKDEPTTSIVYENPTVRSILLKYTTNLVGTTSDTIQEVLISHPENKVMVAYNSVTNCYNLASHLVNSNLISKEDVRILCSISSKDKVGSYYHELNSDVLPARLNFVTSAYFTGFDLLESYHIISVSGNSNKIHAISDNRLKQIAGRSRPGVLSEIVIYDTVPNHNTEMEYTQEQLVEAAEQEIVALKCIDLNYNSNSVLKGHIDIIRKLIVDNTSTGGYRFVRINKDKEAVISYLNLDAFAESLRVRNKLYRSPETLKITLEVQGHQVEYQTVTSSTDVTISDINQEDRADKVTEIISLLRDTQPGIPIDLQLDEDNSPVHWNQLTPYQQEIATIYDNLCEFIEPSQLLDKIEEASLKPDRRMLTNLQLAGYYATLHKDFQYKRTVSHHLPLKQEFTREELLEKWNTIFSELGLHKAFDTLTQAVRFTKLHFKIVKKVKPVRFKIQRENPLDFVILDYRSQSENIGTFMSLLNSASRMR